MSQRLFLCSALLLTALTTYWLYSQGPAHVSHKPAFEAAVDSLYDAKNFPAALEILTREMPAAAARQDWAALAAYTGQFAMIKKDEKQYQEAIDRVSATMSLLRDAKVDNTVFAGKLWVWQALNARKLERWLDALDAYQHTIRCLEAQKSLDSDLPFAYKNAAQIYQRFSNNRLSINYLEAALRSDTAHKYSTSIFANTANAYLFIDSITLAQRYFEQGLAAMKAEDKKGILFHAGADIALAKGDLVAAEKWAKKAMQEYGADPRSGENRVRIHAFLATLAVKGKKNALADEHFQKATMESKAVFERTSREKAKLFNEIGDYHLAQKQPQKALAYYQNALSQVYPVDSADWHATPSPTTAYPESQAMNAALGKAEALLQLDSSLGQRMLAASCFDLGLAVAAKLRQTYGNESDKIDLVADTRRATVSAVMNMRALWEAGKELQHLERLLNLLEQSKAQALRDLIFQNQALQANGVPDTLREREELLRRAIGLSKRNILQQEMLGKEADVALLGLSKSELTRMEIEHQRLLSEVQRGRRGDTKPTEGNEHLTLGQLQKTLESQTALVSFFDAGTKYIALHVTQATAHTWEVRKDSAMQSSLTRLLALLNDKKALENTSDEYFKAAHAVYGYLFESGLPTGTRSLVIIPDGLLCYLPFEALLTSAHTGKYADAPYLIRGCRVRYTWSAILPDKQSGTASGMLQMAPFTQETRDGLAILPNSLLQGIPQMTTVQGKRATSDAFYAQCADFGVLHLASHAHSGGRAIPGIEFYDRTLTLPEIHALRLRAGLVTLSACETGAGRVQAGEGVLSLARAFAGAGAQSLVASHWAVNENATSDLFSRFYAFLKAGKTRSEALGQAKLAYLDSPVPDARKSPYYWAAFTLNGSDGKLDTAMPLWVYVAVGSGLFALIFWILRRKIMRA
jgi:CHAT domain-containing protein